MDKIAAKIPEFYRAEYDEIANFNFANAFKLDSPAVAEVKEVKGHRLQPTFPSEGIEYAYDNWTPMKNDVLVASFPRTGTNWTAEIVRQILFVHDDEIMEMSKNIPMLFLFYEGGGPSKFKVFNHLPLPRRFAASHLPATLINVEKFKQSGAKIINVVRNPKDQTVSWFKFAKKLPYMMLEPVKQLIDCPWKEFFENYTTGKIPLGLPEGDWYLDYLLTWYPHMDGKNVLCVYFEDLKKDLPKEIRHIAAFLDVELTEDLVMKIAKNCGFEEMKSTIEEEKSVADEVRQGFQVMNKGEVGVWKEYFTVKQSEEIDSQVEEKMKGTSIKFTYSL